MHIRSGGRLALVGVIGGTLALGALAGSASAATGDGSDLTVRKAGGEKSMYVTVDPGGGGGESSIIGVL